MSTTIRLGTTTYSFNDEYHSYDLSLESMFETIGSLGPKQGLEIIAPQCIRTYPEVSEEFERRFKHAVERYDLVPSAFGHYSDLGRIPGRNLSIEEAVEFSRIQLEGAKRLGYPLARMSYQSFDLTDRREALYRQLLPDLERLELKLAIEIHAPNIIESEQQQRVIEDVAALNSPYVGFTIDCGCMTSRVSPVCERKFLDLGVDPAIVKRVIDFWATKPSLAELRAEIEAIGGGSLVELLATETWIYFGHGKPASLRAIMPYVLHVHGKFFQVDANGNDDAVAYPEIIDILVSSGYDGWISSEYEGHHWLKNRGAYAQVQAHQRYLSRLINESEASKAAIATQLKEKYL